MAKVCVVTTTRADYGLLRCLVREVDDSPELELQILATGTHFSDEFGHSVDEILSDGFSPDWACDTAPSSSTSTDVAAAFGATAAGVAQALEHLRPDVMVILGDRYEALAAAVAASIRGTTIAHIHGGEVTEGAIDDGFRHAITKLSDLHLVAAEAFRRRVLQLGEAPDRVYVVGALGLDSIADIPSQPSEALEPLAWWHAEEPRVLVTLHPETRSPQSPRVLAVQLINALESIPGASVLITGPNADPGADAIRRELVHFADSRDNVEFVPSLGHINYFQALRHCSLIVGNSSSGVIEAPSFGVPAVDVGDRQTGRPRASSVIHCQPSTDAILDAIGRALSADFRALAADVENPYGGPGASRKIVEILERLSATLPMPTKRFVDVL